jgi:hypothetical protein
MEVYNSTPQGTEMRAEFTSEVQRKLYQNAVVSFCAAEDCQVFVDGSMLVFPAECPNDCGCRQRIEAMAAKKVGAYRNDGN